MIFIKPPPILGIPTHRTLHEREEQERLKAERRYHREIRKVQRDEVKYLGKAIPTWLAKMGHAYWYKKSERSIDKKRFNPIRFSECQIGEDAYFFKVDTKHLPRGVYIASLRDERTIENLTASSSSPVQFHQEGAGCWYVVETKYGRGNIPALVGYAEMLKKMEDDAPPLTFPLGMGENQKPYFGDMDAVVNLLVGGSKGGGKSNAVNVIICTLLTRNSPKNLRLFLTDLKGGIEFADYNGIPHLGGDVGHVKKLPPPDDGSPQKDPWSQPASKNGKDKEPPKYKIAPCGYELKEGEELMPPLGQKICTEPHETLPMLSYIEAELDRRARLFAGHAKKITTWNKKFPDKALSTWLVVIDEMATLMENRKYKKQAEFSLSEIARKGRAAGIFMIVATQTPTSAIVPSQISNNMDCRLAFRTGSGAASGVLLGSGEYDAEKLPAVRGRFIWKDGGKTQLQAPFIADSTVKSIITKCRKGEYTDARTAELSQKADHLFKFALDNLGGKCQSSGLYKHLKSDGFKKAEVEKILTQYEVKDGQPEILINDLAYYLAPPITAKRIARYLVPVADFGHRHPHQDYDYSMINLASRFPLPEKNDPTVYPEKTKTSHNETPTDAASDVDPPPAPPEPAADNTGQAAAVPSWLDDINQTSLKK